MLEKNNFPQKIYSSYPWENVKVFGKDTQLKDGEGGKLSSSSNSGFPHKLNWKRGISHDFSVRRPFFYGKTKRRFSFLSEISVGARKKEWWREGEKRRRVGWLLLYYATKGIFLLLTWLQESFGGWKNNPSGSDGGEMPCLGDQMSTLAFALLHPWRQNQ